MGENATCWPENGVTFGGGKPDCLLPLSRLAAHPANPLNLNLYMTYRERLRTVNLKLRLLWAALLLLLLSSLAQQLQAQQLPAFQDGYRLYREACDLYDQAKYSSAFDKFEQFRALPTERQMTDEPSRHLLVAEAEFYSALCAYNLLNLGAEARFQQFIEHYPDHPKRNQAQYFQARLMILRGNHKEALPLLKYLDPEKLKPEQQPDAQLLLGFTYFANSYYEEANATLEPLTKVLGPYHDRANYYAGLAYLRRKLYDSALVCLNVLEPSAVYAPKIPLPQAQALLALGRYAELERKAQTWLQDSSLENRGQVMRVVGMGLFDQGKVQEALPYLEGAAKDLTLLPDVGATLRLGMAYQILKQPEPALATLKPLTEGNDTIAQAASYHAAFALLELKQPEEARLLFKRAYDFDQFAPISQDALLQYAKVSYQTRYFAEAIASFKLFLQRFPEAPQAATAKGLLGEVLFQSNSFAEAIEYYEQGDLKDSRTRTGYQKALLYYGLDLLERNQLPAAIAQLEKAAEVKGDMQQGLTARFWLGEALYRQGEYKRAQDAYNTYLQVRDAAKNDNYALALLGLGWSYFRNGKYADAQTQFGNVLKQGGLKPDVEVEALCRQGDCQFIRKQYTNALASYDRAIGLRRPGSDYALYQAGLTLSRMERYNEAATRLQRLIDGYRNSPYRALALDQLGDLYVEWLNDYTQARNVSNKLINEYPGNSLVAGAYRRLAKAALKSDNYSETLKYLKVLLFEYGEDDALESLKFLVTIEELKEEEYKNLERQFRRQYPESDSVQAYRLFREALDQINNQNYTSALEKLDLYIERFAGTKTWYDAVLQRGQVREKLGQALQALEDYKTVYTARNADDAGIRALLAAAALQFSRKAYVDAGNLFDQAEKRAETEAQREQALFGRISVQMQTGELARARTTLREIETDRARSSGSRKLASLQLSYLYNFEKQPDSALSSLNRLLAAWEKANEKDIYWSEGRYQLARLLYDQGKPKEAREAALLFKNNNPRYNDWQARAELLIGECYNALGQKVEAQQVFRALATSENIRERYAEVGQQAAQRYYELSGLRIQGYDSTEAAPPEVSSAGSATAPPQLIQPVDVDVSGGRSEATITKERVENLPPSQKYQPTPPQPQLAVPEAGLTFASVRNTYRPKPAPADTTLQPLPREKWAKLYPHRVRLALGRYWSPQAQLHLSGGRNQRLRWNVEAEHFSAPTAHVRRGQFSDTRVAAHVSYLLNKHTLSAGIAYEAFTYNYFADTLIERKRDSLRQQNHRFQLHVSFGNHFRTRGFTYQLPIVLQVYADRRSTSNRQEVLAAFQPRFQYGLKNGMRILVDVDGTLGGVRYGIPTDTLVRQQGFQFRAGVSPAVYYQWRNLRIIAGFGLYGYSSAKYAARIGFFPRVEASYDAFQGYITPYLTLTGRPQFNTLYDLAPVNRWTAADARLRMGTEWVNLQLGGRGHVKLFQYETRFFLRYVQDQLVFTNDYRTASRDTLGADQPYFNAVYEPRFTETGFGLTLAIDDQTTYRAGFRLDYSFYSLPNVKHYFGMPNLRGQLFGSYTFFRKLNVQLTVNLIGARPLGLHANGNLDRGQFIADVNLGIEYRLTPKWAFFVELNNLANMRYYRWQGWLERPLDFRLGLSYAFRLGQ